MITMYDVVVWCERRRAELDDEFRLLNEGNKPSTNKDEDAAVAKMRVRDWIAEVDALLARYGTARLNEHPDPR